MCGPPPKKKTQWTKPIFIIDVNFNETSVALDT